MWSDSGADDQEGRIVPKTAKQLEEDRRIAVQYSRNALDKLNMWAARLIEAGGTIEITKGADGLFEIKAS